MQKYLARWQRKINRRKEENVSSKNQQIRQSIDAKKKKMLKLSSNMYTLPSWRGAEFNQSSLGGNSGASGALPLRHER